jgi:hypothetical protein
MRKLVALRSLLPATLCLLIAGSLFSVQACTAGEGTTPTCEQDVDENGNQNKENGCNPFAVCRADPLNPESEILPASECCKDFMENTPAHTTCLAGFGEGEFPAPQGEGPASSSSSAAAGGGGDAQ